jgi:murein DD-endopeptidase MepM/ murein hydrolase activator NlpD
MATFILILFIALIALMIYFYNSTMFEQKKPTITLNETIHWNLETTIPIELHDTSGIRYYRISITDGKHERELAKKMYDEPVTSVTLDLAYPKNLPQLMEQTSQLRIDVIDGSKWNFFKGNRAQKSATVMIDKKRPTLSLVAHSYGIRYGGSAAVVFYAKDTNLDSVWIENSEDKFQAQPFYKEGYYIALMAWNIKKKKGFRPYIYAQDKAGNVSRTAINFYKKGKKYRKSNLTLNDKFLEGKISELAADQNFDQTVVTPLDKFKAVNETLRKKNEDFIHQLAILQERDQIDNFSFEPFYPLKNGAAVASFGDHRSFFYKGQRVSESYHLGLDLASVKMASIVSQNSAQVISFNSKTVVIKINDKNGVIWKGFSKLRKHTFGIFIIEKIKKGRTTS